VANRYIRSIALMRYKIVCSVQQGIPDLQLSVGWELKFPVQAPGLASPRPNLVLGSATEGGICLSTSSELRLCRLHIEGLSPLEARRTHVGQPLVRGGATGIPRCIGCPGWSSTLLHLMFLVDYTKDAVELLINRFIK
jgi:hypothetical protein